MFIAAIRCDFCQKAHEIPCRKTSDKPDVPIGWAVITPMIRIKGTPNQGDLFDGKAWNYKTQKYDLDPSDEQINKQKERKSFTERRDKLRARFDKAHVCLDCIEEIMTGRVSLKIGMNNG